MEPGSYLIVYASGLDPTLDISNTNTSLKLTQTKSSEYIVLTDNNEQIIDYQKVDRHQLTHSWGRSGGFEWNVFESPTPGNNNTSSTGYNSYVSVPTFDVQSGFFNNSSLIVTAGAVFKILKQLPFARINKSSICCGGTSS